MGRTHSRTVATAVALALIALGCSSGGDSSESKADPTGDVLTAAELDAIDEAAGGECDPLDPRHCLLPFPSDSFTTEDPDTDTGRLVAFPEAAMPTNVDGVVVDPTEWNRNDGFSPGSMITTHFPGVDLEASGAAPEGDIGRSLDEDAPVVLIDAETGERHPYWVEVDANASGDDTALTIIRPAVNLPEGHRMVVGIRGMQDGDGAPFEPTAAFRALRDGVAGDVEVLDTARDRFDDEVFAVLEDAGVARSELQAGWDFTVASERNLSERMLHIRDTAFDDLGDDAPFFRITDVTERPDPEIARRIEGRFEVPSYLTGDGGPGERFDNGADGLPVADGTITASFTCIIPRSLDDGGGDLAIPEGRLAVYGHGLLGSRGEVEAGNVRAMANEHGFVFCATDWIGMAEEDIGNALEILGELGRFPTLADRVQQGILNTLFLGRLMIHENGLTAEVPFRRDGEPIADPGELFFDGNSQGAIIGGAATAVAQDWERAVLGVGGMNYSTLLRRSVDFDTYAQVLEPAYPDEVERTLGLALIQMLWDRAETNGYAAHVTDDPYPDTPAHQVLFHEAFGDHQVANTTLEVLARTAGVAIRRPELSEGRDPAVDPFWDLTTVEDDGEGSVLVVWDSGTPAPPEQNTPPQDDHDPHEDPRADAQAREQKSAFLRAGGRFMDVCSRPCTADPVD